MDEIIETQKRGRPARISATDIFCLRAYVLDRRTMKSIGDELGVKRQRVNARLKRFGVRSGRDGLVVGDEAAPFLQPAVPEAVAEAGRVVE